MDSEGNLLIVTRFYIYALHGCACEVCFTALWEAFESGNRRLHGVTSVYVFLIYGISVLVMEQLYIYLRPRFNLLVRGIVYLLWTYSWEFSTGFVLRLFDACPWDYETLFQGHFMGLITIEYAPFWYVAGIFSELVVIDYTMKLRWKSSPEIAEIEKDLEEPKEETKKKEEPKKVEETKKKNKTKKFR